MEISFKLISNGILLIRENLIRSTGRMGIWYTSKHTNIQRNRTSTMWWWTAHGMRVKLTTQVEKKYVHT